MVRPAAEWAEPGLPTLTGFENHGAVTELGPDARPVGEVMAGVGNKDGTVEGAVAGRVWGTYLHGPVLAATPNWPTCSCPGWLARSPGSMTPNRMPSTPNAQNTGRSSGAETAQQMAGGGNGRNELAQNVGAGHDSVLHGPL